MWGQNWLVSTNSIEFCSKRTSAFKQKERSISFNTGNFNRTSTWILFFSIEFKIMGFDQFLYGLSYNFYHFF